MGGAGHQNSSPVAPWGHLTSVPEGGGPQGDRADPYETPSREIDLFIRDPEYQSFLDSLFGTEDLPIDAVMEEEDPDYTPDEDPDDLDVRGEIGEYRRDRGVQVSSKKAILLSQSVLIHS